MQGEYHTMPDLEIDSFGCHQEDKQDREHGINPKVWGITSASIFIHWQWHIGTDFDALNSKLHPKSVVSDFVSGRNCEGQRGVGMKLNRGISTLPF